MSRAALALLLMVCATPALNHSSALRALEPKSVAGSVSDKRGNFLPGAVVQLEDLVSLEIQSFLIHADGKYHFANLNPDVDYTVHAEYRKHLSKTAAISRFSGKRHEQIDLVIPVE